MRCATNPLRHEDVAHVSDKVLRPLVKREDLHASLQEVVRMVHFDLARPANMNVYVPEDSTTTTNAMVYEKTGWQARDLQYTARAVALGAGALMSAHMDEHESKYPKKVALRFDDWYAALDKDPRVIDMTAQTLRECSSRTLPRTL